MHTNNTDAIVARDDDNNESCSGLSLLSEVAEEEASTGSGNVRDVPSGLSTSNATALAGISCHSLSLRHSQKANNQEEEDDSYIIQESDIVQVCQQLKEIMGEFQGVSVSDLKLVFNNSRQASSSKPPNNNYKSPSTSHKEPTKEPSSPLADHSQSKFPTIQTIGSSVEKEPSTNNSSSSSVVVSKIFGGPHPAIASTPWRTATLNLPSKEHADLKAQKELVEILERDRNEMKKKLLQADSTLKDWQDKCQKKQERCQALECQTETLKKEVEGVRIGLSNLEDEKKGLLLKNQELESVNATLAANKLRLGRDGQVTKRKSQEDVACPVTIEGAASREESSSCPKGEELVAVPFNEATVTSTTDESEAPTQFNKPRPTSKVSPAGNTAMKTESLTSACLDRAFADAVCSCDEAPALLPDEATTKLQRSKQLMAESRQALGILIKKLNVAKQEALQSQLKLVEQIKRANDYENRLEACREQVEELRRDRSTLQRKVQDLTKRTSQVAELEESVTTQQLQIESLSMVNRELRQKVVENGSSCDGDSTANENYEKRHCDGFDSDTEDNGEHSNASSQIETLEALWDQQNAQMAKIHQEQVELFHRLGKSNSEATTKIDSLCDSMDELSRSFSWDDDHDTTLERDQIVLISTDSSDKLEVIHETGGGSGQDDGAREPSVIERCELAWKEQASKIEAIQRDQDEVICRIRISTAHAESKLHRLSYSIEEEDAHVDHSKVVRRKQNEVLRALQEDNKRLAKKLRDSEAKASNHIGKLQEMLENQKAKKDELQGTCRVRELCMAELKEEKTMLLHKSETIKDLLMETDKMCEKQKEALVELQLNKQSREKDLEAQRSIVVKMEEITTQQQDTIKCLRSERQTMEKVIDEKNFRIKELEAVVAFQKTAINGLQREKSTLTKRLLDTDEEFRNHLTRNLTVQAQIETLRNDLTLAVKNGNSGTSHSNTEDLPERVVMETESFDVEDTHQTDTAAETTFDDSTDDQCSITIGEDNRDKQLPGEDDVFVAKSQDPAEQGGSDEVSVEGGDDQCEISAVEVPTNEDASQEDHANGASEDGDEDPTEKKGSDKLVAKDVLRLLSFT